MCVNMFDKCYIGLFLTLKKEYLEDSFRLSYLKTLLLTHLFKDNAFWSFFKKACFDFNGHK